MLRSLSIARFYPPTWLFAFFGAFLYHYLISLIYNATYFDWSVIGLSILSFIPGIIFASILDSLFPFRLRAQATHARSDEKTIKNFRTLLKDPSVFIKWLNKETPIQSSEEDLFDSAIFAKRIAKMLRATPLKTIAVVGSYGCGKSSIMNMVEEYLKTPEGAQDKQSSTIENNLISPDKIVRCKVHGWGLQKDAAVEHILQAILSELAKSVDCLGLTRIPADYRAALSGSSWFNSFAVLSCTTTEPFEILCKLDTVLACNGKRMIIFLEDLDRNTAGSVYWKELTSLLDRLKDLDNISFVLAINQTSKTYDTLIRVCEHTEFIPTLPQNEVLECVKYFRDICLDKYIDVDIDCRIRKERDEHIGLKKTSQEYEIAAMIEIEVIDPIMAIIKLLNNPRTLKSTLRRSWQSWKSLHGEIDYDDLFVARIIYTVAPEAFAFINRHIPLLRYFNTESTSEFTRKRQEENRKQLEAMWQNIEGSWDRRLVKTLIDFLFPGWIKDDFYKGNVHQGVIHSQGADYWIRLNREELTTDENPDQVVLHALHNWKADHNYPVHQGFNLSEAILNLYGFAKEIERFGHLLDGQDIRSLAHELFELIRKDRYNIHKDEYYRGFLELWRLSLGAHVGNHDEWILGEIGKTLPISLRFANELYYYWRNQERHSASADTPTPILRTGFIQAARQVYENNTRALIDALDPAYMYSIHHFMILWSRKDHGGPGFNPTEWEWLIDVLIEAGKENSQIIIPQLVTLVSDQNSSFKEGPSYSFNEESIDSIFGKDKSTILELLATKIDTSMFDEQEKHRIEYVQKAAEARIRK